MKFNSLKIILLTFSVLICCESCSTSYKLKTININDTTTVDQCEIGLGTWLSYYSWTKRNINQEDARKLLPDSNCVEKEVWQYIKMENSHYSKRYVDEITNMPLGYFPLKWEAFSGKTKPTPILLIPITGISYNQALEFCKWRTAYCGNNEWIYKLPSEDEWKWIAKKALQNDKHSTELKDSLGKDQCPNYNYNFIDLCEEFKKDSISPGIAAIHCSKEVNNCFDIFGNVAEMTAEKGVAKGGSYKHFASQSHIDSIQHYDKPEAWLGFRCIAIKRKSKNYPYYVNAEDWVADGDNIAFTKKTIDFNKFYVDPSLDSKVVIDSYLEILSSNRYSKDHKFYFKPGYYVKDKKKANCHIFQLQSAEQLFAIAKTDSLLQLLTPNEISSFYIKENEFVSCLQGNIHFFLKKISKGNVDLYLKKTVSAIPHHYFYLKKNGEKTVYSILFKEGAGLRENEGKTVEINGEAYNVIVLQKRKEVEEFLLHLPNLTDDIKKNIQSRYFTFPDIETIIKDYNSIRN